MTREPVKLMRSNETNEKTSASETDSAETGGRLKIQKTYKLFVGGRFPRTESGRYYKVESKIDETVFNICLSSRKDLRDAVTIAKAAQESWARATAYNKGQILYRIAEMLEGRKAQFVEELKHEGSSDSEAKREVNLSIDRLVYYAGWSDKYQQVFSQVNPVAVPYFNFSILEPMGVVGIIAPEETGLLGLVSLIAPAIVGGNSVVALTSESKPLAAVTFSEVLHSSDLPSGVVNLLTGTRKELLSQFSSHMEINALIYAGSDADEIKKVQESSIPNLKRVSIQNDKDWYSTQIETPYAILDTQETKTTWHPVG